MYKKENEFIGRHGLRRLRHISITSALAISVFACQWKHIPEGFFRREKTRCGVMSQFLVTYVIRWKLIHGRRYALCAPPLIAHFGRCGGSRRHDSRLNSTNPQPSVGFRIEPRRRICTLVTTVGQMY